MQSQRIDKRIYARIEWCERCHHLCLYALPFHFDAKSQLKNDFKWVRTPDIMHEIDLLYRIRLCVNYIQLQSTPHPTS